MEKNMTLKHVRWMFAEVLITDEDICNFWKRYHIQCALMR